MIAQWTFTGGRLEACDKNGSLLGQWEVDASMGLPLAGLLNHNPGLSRLLLGCSARKGPSTSACL